MTAAIFGLLGVLVGGILSGFVSWRLERAREAAAARGVKRLLSNELLGWQAILQVADRQKKWWPDSGVPPDSTTVEDRKLLARQLSDDDWDRLVHAEHGLRLLREAREANPSEDPKPSHLALQGQAIQTIKLAREMLDELGSKRRGGWGSHAADLGSWPLAKLKKAR